MTQSLTEERIGQVLDANRFGSFGTVEAGGKPKVRYMAVYHEGLNIYLATDRKTHKVEELEDNPNAFLLVGYESGGSKDVLEVEARVSISSDESLRKQVWNPDLSRWFKGPEDPDYVVLKLDPQRIELESGGERSVWEKAQG
ncbi:pyridoxamine 5'-phosphate oxidase family protein [Paenibacillus glufosinatiresistens]|uniref:pyridoxamine 5'-phosphate oxidase family protein n=1 Tax=Paenibacillus glufosinatiresistens TaxID=3070657 RepID=UPI00286DE483|nr:pyridoxamine 5'-phosphate oxidase family protein [Paenibacillus sp. YX.27]